MTTDTELLSALRARLPNTRRKSDFYRKLDGFLPEWGSLVSEPEFASWMMQVDSESGACMFDWLNGLWQNPVYSSENFAALLRLFVQWKRDRDGYRTPSSRQGTIKAFDAFLAVIGDESVSFNRAVCLEKLGCHAQALEVYEGFAVCNDVRGLVNGSNCLRSLGRKDEALSYAQRAVELDASDGSSWIL